MLAVRQRPVADPVADWSSLSRRRSPLVLSSLVLLLVAIIVGAAFVGMRLVGSETGEGAAAPLPVAPTTPPIGGFTTAGPEPTSADPTTETTSRGPGDPTSALRALQNAASADKPRADALVGTWVPQVSSKRDGLEADGIRYDHLTIWENYEQWKRRFPDALLLRSDTYASYSLKGFWVVVIDSGSAGKDVALAWCDSEGLPADDCIAKRIAHDGDSRRNTAYR